MAASFGAVGFGWRSSWLRVALWLILRREVSGWFRVALWLILRRGQWLVLGGAAVSPLR